MRRVLFPFGLLAVIIVAFVLALLPRDEPASAPNDPTATSGLPLDVQYAVLDVYATSTQAAATADAAAGATQSSAATAARRLTEEALQVQQQLAELEALRTQTAISVSLQIGAATDAAGATQRAATATVAAESTQAALDRLGLVATATAIAAWAGTRAAGAQGLGFLAQGAVVIALVLLLVIAALVTWGVYARQYNRTEIDKATRQQLADERVEQERLKTDLLMVDLARAKAEAVRALMVDRGGEPWRVTDDGRLLPMLSGGLPAASQNNRAREMRWRSALKGLVYNGVALGEAHGKPPRFGERDLAGPDEPSVINADGSPSSAGYRQLQRLLVRMGVWVVIDRKGTSWAPDWTLARFERDFDVLPLPTLPEGEPPTVRLAIRSSTVPAIPAVSAAPQ